METITDQVADAEPDETGGILLGYEASGSDEVVITHLVGPGPNFEASSSHFDPDGEWQEKEVARIYAESGRHATYLGDWHSHPKGAARPSRKDQRTARSIAEFRDARMPHPLMLIVATNETGFRLAAFRYRHGKLRWVAVHRYGGGDASIAASLAAHDAAPVAPSWSSGVPFR
jgi:integrative and conjugative element protein (TIGR02256 family)